MNDHYVETVPLAEMIDIGLIGPSDASLAELSGERWRLGPDDPQTYVTVSCEAAWNSRLDEFTCEHLRILISQSIGVDLLAAAAVDFVCRYPQAEAKHHPGDVTIAVLKKLDEIARIVPDARQRIRVIDFSWIEQEFDLDREVNRELRELLDNARA